MGAQSTAMPMDTSAEVWAVAHERLGVLGPAERVHLANTMSIDCERLARAGIAVSEPSASPSRVRYLLAARRYGSDFAEAMAESGAC